jgi:hypothetical protein
MSCLPSSFFLLQGANLIGPSLKKKELWRLPKIEGSILKYRSSSPLAHLHRWKDNNICHPWDESEVLWRTCWGTHWELEEHIRNPPTHTPLPIQPPSLFVIYIHESSTLAEPYGIRVRFYWEQLGNTLKTWWELDGNQSLDTLETEENPKKNKIPWYGCIFVIFYEKESNTKWPTKRKTTQQTLLPLCHQPHISQHLIVPLPTMR